MKRYTIKDIAEELNISPATVSIIINNRPNRFSEKTRKAVFDLVKKYNYTPNLSARTLVTNRSQIIGLIVPDISNPYFAELAKGVEQAAQRHDYSVIFTNSHNEGRKDLSNANLLIGRQVDGIIMCPSIGDDDAQTINQFNTLIENSSTPVVLADRTLPFSNYNISQSNNRQGGFLATKHLLDLGHKHIGCITGPLTIDSANQRYLGFMDAMFLAGIPMNPAHVFQGDYQMSSGIQGAKELLTQDISAIFACNDLMALGVLIQIRECGFAPGRDISLIGFDDIPISSLLDMPLTTINQSLYDVGKNAVHLIVREITSAKSQVESIKHTPTVVVRKTTAPPV